MMLNIAAARSVPRFGQLSERAATLWEANRLPETEPTQAQNNLDRFEHALNAERTEAEAHRQSLEELSEQVAEQLKKAAHYRDLPFMTGLFAGFADIRKKAAHLPEPSRRVWEDGLKILETQTKDAALTLVNWGSPSDALRRLGRLEAQQKAGVPVPHKIMSALRERAIRVSRHELDRHITGSARIVMGFEKGWYQYQPGGRLQRLPGLVKLRQEVDEQCARTMKFPLAQKQAWEVSLQALERELNREWQNAVRALSPLEAEKAVEQMAESPIPIRDEWVFPLLRRASDFTPKT